jgi:hypothetical protein
MSAIESRQDELDEKLSQVLVGNKAHADALKELKTMFAKYIGKFCASDEGSPLVSKSALENTISHPSPLVEYVEEEEAEASQNEELEVDVHDTSPTRTTTDSVKITLTTDRRGLGPEKRDEKAVDGLLEVGGSAGP